MDCNKDSLTPAGVGSAQQNKLAHSVEGSQFFNYHLAFPACNCQWSLIAEDARSLTTWTFSLFPACYLNRGGMKRLWLPVGPEPSGPLLPCSSTTDRTPPPHTPHTHTRTQRLLTCSISSSFFILIGSEFSLPRNSKS